MAYYDDREQLLSKNESRTVQSPDLYCSGDFTFIKDIASGGMSRISLFYLKKDGCSSKVVVKRLFPKIFADRDLKYLRTEVDILTRVDHQNIIQTYGIANIDVECGLVLEYLPNGSYMDFFNKFWENNSGTNEIEEKIAPLKIRIIGEIISAMEYLHRPRKLLSFPKEKSILHLDLKRENVLLDQNLHVKICDFGLSMMSTLTRLCSSTTIHRGVSGTPGFIAPERLRNPDCKPNTKCDVFSFGILEYAILTDSPPYPDDFAHDFGLLQHHLVKNKYRPNSSNISSIFPADMIVMMEECWSAHPDCRPAFRALAPRIIAIIDKIPDFAEKARDSVNFVMNPKSQSNITSYQTLPDLLSFRDTESHPIKDKISSGTATSSGNTATNSNMADSASPFGNTDRNSASSFQEIYSRPTTVGNALASGLRQTAEIENSSTTAVKVPLHMQRSQNTPPSRTDVKMPISCEPQNNASTNNTGNIRIRISGDGGSSSTSSSPCTPSNRSSLQSDDDSTPLTPSSEPTTNIRAINVERPFCSATKILLSVSTIVICAAALTIALTIPLIHNSSGRTCPDVKRPDHGNVTCRKESKNTAEECRFSCDNGYEIFGSDTLICNGWKWSKGEPSCERACNKLPDIPNGVVQCSNQTFVHSTCLISCKNHHIIQGKEVITCLGNGSWSDPFPSCVCPICTVGDNCEYSISWQDVYNNLEAMTSHGNISVNYGGQIFVCSAHAHSIFDWTGKCIDKDTGTEKQCDDDHTSLSGAADAAAAGLIRDLVKRKIYLDPCDPSKMPRPEDC